MQAVTKTGTFTTTVDGLDGKGTYEFRAVIKHPLLTLYGAEVRTK
jgi:alpha-L-fucosidase